MVRPSWDRNLVSTGVGLCILRTSTSQNCKRHLSQIGFLPSVQVGWQDTTEWCPLVDKASREPGSLPFGVTEMAWRPFGVTEMDWIHLMYCGLSICPERQKPIIQCCWQGSYENSAWKTGFSGCEHLCVSACVCERERDRETQGEHTQALRGRQDIDFIRFISFSEECGWGKLASTAIS